jgi:3-deoxy-D-manno-octulosonate 8-phosphate phosphatase (KDO 8-P phosphatase)
METVSVRLLILDVDGVLTDGSVVPVSTGLSAKAFCVQDGCAIKLWQKCDGKVAILSGRSEEAVIRRARELGIEWVHTGVKDKMVAYEAILAAAACDDCATGYIGDDLPDLGPMSRCGFPVAVANAVPAVKRIALYVTRRSGGHGAAAEVVELLLRKQKRWVPSQLGDI